MRRTRKTEELLELIRHGAGEDGIYALAAAAGRPYRRVHEQVRNLAEDGQVRLEPVSTAPRKKLRVRPIGSRKRKPRLSFNRGWSRPSGGFDDDTLIAQVLSRPTFRDMLACAEHYGLQRIRTLRDAMIADFELPPGAAGPSGRMLKNIEIGFARAAGID